MPITDQQLISAIETRNGFPFNSSQSSAILHGNGPLAIVAGPGTGKTEVLVVRTLKLLCCDSIDAKSIILTTFTDKAAISLEDRVNDAFLALVSQFPNLQSVDGIDPSELRIGTLHGLCNDILQEFRYPQYQNLRLMDDIESSLFIHRKVVPQLTDVQKRTLYYSFRYLLGRQFQNSNPLQVGRWQWVDILQKLFDRQVEDLAATPQMASSSGGWPTLANTILTYESELNSAYACDFPRLQQYFLDFLASAQGDLFRRGDPARPTERPPLSHVLVDEYQDTNPIQEEIYFQLCQAVPHNLTVVGDDDQALYRFRGGTVECMVGIPSACQTRFGVTPATVYLADNYRSDNGIVTFCNDFILSHPTMTSPGVRMQGKPSLNCASGRAGGYPAVGLIRESRVPDLASSMTRLVSELQCNGVITDYSQCVLLLPSVKNTPRNAGPYIDALSSMQIPVYNPRSRGFLDQDEVAELLGAFVSVVDPGMTTASRLMSAPVQQMIAAWVARYDALRQSHSDLANYVNQASARILQAGRGEELSNAFPTIVYRILAHEPFPTYQRTMERDSRLSKLTRLFEAFSTQYGRHLYSDNQTAGTVSSFWLNGFYYGLCGYLERQGLDDDEDDELICPQGMFPIMTIWQAKGLEFDFVFVGNLGGNVSASATHQLEADFLPFRTNTPSITHTADELAWHDEIRLHFVAYSRARYSLVLLATNTQLRKQGSQTASFGGGGGPRIRQTIERL